MDKWDQAESKCRIEVCEYKNMAYESIAMLGMIGVPDDMIRNTLVENLRIKMTELMELFKYTILSAHIYFSIEDSLRLFELIKRFHKLGLTTDPRFPNMRLAIVRSLFLHKACLKPEIVIAQNWFYSTPVNFSAWTNIVDSIKERFPEVDEHESLPPASQIINIFTNHEQFVDDHRTHYYDIKSIYVDTNPTMMDILTGLIVGAGMTIPPAENHDVALRIKFNRFELLRASFGKLDDLNYLLNHGYLELRPQFIMLFRLIIANHFETIPNDVNHPITFQSSICVRGSDDLFDRLKNFLCPPSTVPQIV